MTGVRLWAVISNTPVTGERWEGEVSHEIMHHTYIVPLLWQLWESCTRQHCWHTRHCDQRLHRTWPICFNHRHRHGRCGRLVPLCWACRGHEQFWRLVRFLWRHPPFGTLCRAMFDCLVLALHTLLRRNWKLLCSVLHTYSVTWRQRLCILGRYGAIEIVLLLLLFIIMYGWPYLLTSRLVTRHWYVCMFMLGDSDLSVTYGICINLCCNWLIDWLIDWCIVCRKVTALVMMSIP